MVVKEKLYISLISKGRLSITKLHYVLRFLTLPLLLLICSLVYYFGELVEWAAWDALRNEFFYGIHDVHRLLFLAPIIYAGYVGRVKGAIIVTLITFMILLPRGMLISPFPDPLLRMVLFVIIAGVIGIFTGVIRDESDKIKQLETAIKIDRDKLFNIIDSMSEGILITDPDYKIRFVNSNMVNDLGEGTGLTCYKYLFERETPCKRNCLIRKITGEKQTMKRDYKIKDKTYKVVSTPYVDADGTVCHLSIFRKLDSEQ
jgi:PAS domain-containing protein